MTDPLSHDDPGWPRLRSMAATFIPGMLIRREGRPGDDGGGGLVSLRLVFIAFGNALVLIGAVVLILHVSGGLSGVPGRTATAALAVGAVGVGALVALRLFVPALDCSSDPALASSYRTRFFLRIAFSEAAALVGFAAFVVAGSPWLYLLGAAFAAVGYTVAAPSRRNLERDEEQLRAAGCGRSLTRVLNASRLGDG